MIIVIDGLNQDAFSDVLEDVFRLRKRVFHDRLGWEVTVTNGMEYDRFDALYPAHVVSLDDEGNVVGCMRLLQTTGPHMLSDVFSAILDGEPPIRSSTVWEATRFCVDMNRLKSGRGRNTISYVTSEVMIGAFEYGMAAGITDAVAVIDPVMDRVLKRGGNAPCGYLGTPKPMGKVTALAALMDVTPERVAAIRNYAGIHHDVFVDEDSLRKQRAMAA
ncbi:acyl homoserine lactone synthase [Meinhardsimonia xiamenensis]|jgi:acyl homoserine lactone synthase|uniref:Acyl-homoserine-lactone synthase n=1 Tax=Meinhardsimonia xiamenensis TaxID=990712 RepID=A0A1G8Z6T6_9RHOB|nr:acyl-homoserine-lactone synthase [Meinhardsimonia xiamenensis]PRX37579.1 acyl homoserine lactone synthase [Meinhardsimonia xiamenensis]SDK10799.1 acyl homoserine lactone synthase [Meinhardsimonia xiamenensis]